MANQLFANKPTLKPARLQLSRAKGFELQKHSQRVNGLDAVNVARPGQWGNPFVVGLDGTREECVDFFTALLVGHVHLTAQIEFTELKEIRSRMLRNMEELRGKNLACWCVKDSKPCHADALLLLANAPKCEEVRP